MPNFSAYLDDNTAVDAANRAVLAWRRIQDNPTVVTVRRGASNLDPQTVRLEYSTAARESTSAAGAGTIREVVLIGVVDHPTVDDTNIRKGDRFVNNLTEYRVVDVVAYPGEVQAELERVS